MDKPCQIWTGATYTVGYGRIGEEYAHRVAFREAHGYLPKVVRHSCDNKLCVEITHLVAGTQQDNIQDMWDRQRARPRGRVPMTPAELEAIVTRLAAGETLWQVARASGYSLKHVWRIKHGWRPKGGDAHAALD